MFAAADGCKKGWVVAIAAAWPLTTSPSLHVVANISELLTLTRDADRIMLDMPIGLTDRGARQCDQDARKMLGQHSSRCFFAPPRAALHEETWDGFVAAHRAAGGVGLSKQAFNFTPKIREVDAIMTPKLQQRLREFHPELTFMHLAGKPLPSKHSAQGILARLQLLRPHIPGLDDLHQQSATCNAGIDDVLDALVGLIAAAQPAGCLPAKNAPLDARGLRCEINY